MPRNTSRYTPQDRVVLLTDGVPDTRSLTRERFADNALFDLLRETRQDCITTAIRYHQRGLSPPGEHRTTRRRRHPDHQLDRPGPDAPRPTTPPTTLPCVTRADHA